MITFDKLWLTMKRKGISQYDLYTHYGISRSMINRLKHNKNIQTNTISILCEILDCGVCDIMEFVKKTNNIL